MHFGIHRIFVQRQIVRYLAGVLITELLTMAAFAQTPVFEDMLTNASQTSGQWGSGIFSEDGYMLTHSGGYSENGQPRSMDYVWYDLSGVGSDGSGTVEFDVTGLYPNQGCDKNELAVMCDSTGLNPATTGGDYYNSPYTALMRKDNNTGGSHVNKMKISAHATGGSSFEARTNVLSWNGTTTYRFRITWSGTSMRIYRGLPGQALTLLSPPTPYHFGVAWSPNILHIQIGSTFRAGPRGVKESGGAPGTLYSLLRVYEDDLGDQATPGRAAAPVIAEVTPNPDTMYVGNEYVRQLILVEGSPTPTWSVIQGPTGAQVSSSGLVSGWTPTANDGGSSFTFIIQAVNSEGSDTEQWDVQVRFTADFDNDNDVDQEDFGVFQVCYSGSGREYPSGCENADFDTDDDVDSDDFDIFQQCMSGANVEPGC